MDAHDVHVAGSSANNSVSLAVDALQCAGWLRNKHHMKPHTVHAMRRAPSPRRRMQMMGSVWSVVCLLFRPCCRRYVVCEDPVLVLSMQREKLQHPRLGQGDKGPMRILSMAKRKRQKEIFN
ncbi:hypothetical protein FSOLCH5_007266 [Fusarium solani]